MNLMASSWVIGRGLFTEKLHARAVSGETGMLVLGKGRERRERGQTYRSTMPCPTR